MATEVVDSIDNLQVAWRTASEVSGVELIRCSNGHTWILSQDSRIIPRHTVLGGYGTGRYIPQDSAEAWFHFFLFCNDQAAVIQHVPAFSFASCAEAGVPLRWPIGDKTLVQIDNSSVNAEDTSTSIMTLYRYMTMLERVKRVSSYGLSYSQCTRNGVEFKVELSDPHKYHVTTAVDQPNCKSWFGKLIKEVLRRFETTS